MRRIPSLPKDASAGADGVTYAEYEDVVWETCKLYMIGSRMGSIRRNHYAGSTFQRKTGNRDRSRFHRWRTRSSLLMEMIGRRVADGRILRLIGKWINVGVIEDGRLLVTETGTGQGQIISPLLANIFLHYVLDEWFEKEVKPRLKGRRTWCGTPTTVRHDGAKRR